MSIVSFGCMQKHPNTDAKNENQKKIDVQNPLATYVFHPADKDSTCKADQKRAEKDVQMGKILYCKPMGFGSFWLRCENQMRKLCKKQNLIFDYELISDVVVTGQTQGCYGAYMDNVIASKFGPNFKEHLLAQADSMLLASNDAIDYFLCDKRPQIPGKDDYDIVMDTIVPISLRSSIKTDKDGEGPFMDIGFYIDKEGNASGYSSDYYYVANNKSNKKYENELFKIGITKVKGIKKWEPGMVRGQKVKTKNNVRVYFTLN